MDVSMGREKGGGKGEREILKEKDTKQKKEMKGKQNTQVQKLRESTRRLTSR